jgi:hypothetical protein
MSNVVRAIWWYVLITQRIQNVIWHKKNWREIVLTSKCQAWYCLSLQSKLCGRSADISSMCVTLFTVRRERRGKDNLHITCFHKLQELKPKCCWTVLGLIAKRALVPGGGESGTPKLNNSHALSSVLLYWHDSCNKHLLKQLLGYIFHL